MKRNIILLFAIVIIVIVIALVLSDSKNEKIELDPTPKKVTLTGTYICLPHKNKTGPQTEECAFGIKTNTGDYYAVNFGQSAQAMEQFQNGETITAEGFTVIKEALSTNYWDKYDMEGIFTITKIISSNTVIQGKLNINAICEESLMYMTFENGQKTDEFVAECKEGKHPNVIEEYKKRMGLGDGVAI
jgi:hypothetical protein